MSLKRRILEGAIDAAVKALQVVGGTAATAILASCVNPVVTVRGGGKNLRFRAVSRIAYHRALSLLSKEPDTITWIDTLADNDVLYDVGANVGVYTLYAALTRRCQVIACEPSAANYAELVRNIALNSVEQRVIASCTALSDVDCVDYINMPEVEVGSALSSFGDAVDQNGNPFAPIFRQSVFGHRLDSLIEQYRLLPPTHIKIDVDGLQAKVIAGALQTLSRPRVRSLAVELNETLARDREFIERRKELGFCVTHTVPSGGPVSHIVNMYFARS